MDLSITRGCSCGRGWIVVLAVAITAGAALA